MRAGRITADQSQSTGPRDADRRAIPVVQCDQPSDQYFYRRIQLALSAARRVTIVCGAGISTSAGIPDFRSAGGLYNCKLPGFQGNILGSELFDVRALLEPQKLLACGRATGEFRTTVRRAQPTPAHDYIAKLHKLGRLLRCYTQNIDGLQTRGRPDMAKVVLELHGSIERLSCNRCRQFPDGNAQDLDERLVQDGFLQCEKCGQRGETSGPNVKWDLRRLPPGLLLPQILHNEGSWEVECDGMNMDELEQADGHASLLLVIGTSIRTDGVARLVRSLARKVHGSGGTVVYIDRGTLSDGRWAEYVDVQLRTEIDVWARDASRHLDAMSERDEIGREVTEVMQAFRRREIQLSSNDTHSDMRLHNGLYPELVEGGSIAAVARPVVHRRLLFLVCHSGALSSLAWSMALQLIGLGKDRGCICHSYVVVLSGSGELSSQVSECTNDYLVVVHLSDYLLRLRSPWRCTEPGQTIKELLEQSVCTMRVLSERSHGSMITMICAEDELLSERGTSGLEESFRRQTTFETMITSLNLSRFKTGSWVNFLMDVALSHFQGRSDPVDIGTQWMDNEVFFKSSDLVLFARGARTAMFLASEFDDRPMGKPLPSIGTTCPCEPTQPGAYRKVWEVQHDATDACIAKYVKVTEQFVASRIGSAL